MINAEHTGHISHVVADWSDQLTDKRPFNVILKLNRDQTVLIHVAS